MYNYLMLIGRVCTDVEKRTSENGVEYINLLLAIKRPFKNPETNEYDTDFIPVTVFGSGYDTNNLKKGDLVGVKGRISTNSNKKNENEKLQISLIGERIMFYSHPNAMYTDNK